MWGKIIHWIEVRIGLKELVDKGVFGDVPGKNNFGWYQLKREWPDRFEEIVTVRMSFPSATRGS